MSVIKAGVVHFGEMGARSGTDIIRSWEPTPAATWRLVGWMALFNSGKKTGILLKIVGWAAGGGRYQDGTVQMTPNMSTVTPRTCSSWSNLETEKHDFQSQIREIHTHTQSILIRNLWTCHVSRGTWVPRTYSGWSNLELSECSVSTFRHSECLRIFPFAIS